MRSRATCAREPLKLFVCLEIDVLKHFPKHGKEDVHRDLLALVISLRSLMFFGGNEGWEWFRPDFLARNGIARALSTFLFLLFCLKGGWRTPPPPPNALFFFFRCFSNWPLFV